MGRSLPSRNGTITRTHEAVARVGRRCWAGASCAVIAASVAKPTDVARTSLRTTPSSEGAASVLTLGDMPNIWPRQP